MLIYDERRQADGKGCARLASTEEIARLANLANSISVQATVTISYKDNSNRLSFTSTTNTELELTMIRGSCFWIAGLPQVGGQKD